MECCLLYTPPLAPPESNAVATLNFPSSLSTYNGSIHTSCICHELNLTIHAKHPTSFSSLKQESLPSFSFFYPEAALAVFPFLQHIPAGGDINLSAHLRHAVASVLHCWARHNSLYSADQLESQSSTWRVSHEDRQLRILSAGQSEQSSPTIVLNWNWDPKLAVDELCLESRVHTCKPLSSFTQSSSVLFVAFDS